MNPVAPSPTRDRHQHRGRARHDRGVLRLESLAWQLPNHVGDLLMPNEPLVIDVSSSTTRGRHLPEHRHHPGEGQRGVAGRGLGQRERRGSRRAADGEAHQVGDAFRALRAGRHLHFHADRSNTSVEPVTITALTERLPASAEAQALVGQTIPVGVASRRPTRSTNPRRASTTTPPT